MIYKNRFSLIGVVCLIVLWGILLINQAVAQDKDISAGSSTNPPKPPSSDNFPKLSKLDATGKEFVLKDGIFDLKLVSSEEIHLFLEAIPKKDEGKPASVAGMINIHIEPITPTTKKETQITITGLEVFYPNGSTIPLHRYQEGHLKETFQVDSEGKYSFTQDISDSHHLWISTETSTLYIGNGKSSPYYDYDSKTRTYTFKNDYTGTIVVTDSNITIDGNGHTFSGQSGIGIYRYLLGGVYIRGFTLTNYYYAIYFVSCADSIITENTLYGNTYGIALYDHCAGNIISWNTIGPNNQYGVSINYKSAYNSINNNTIFQNHNGIVLSSYEVHRTDVRDNTIWGNTGNGIYIGYKCGFNSIYNNSIESNAFGITNDYRAYGTSIYWNTIRYNTYGIHLPSDHTPWMWQNNIYANWGYNSLVLLGYWRVFTHNHQYTGIGNYWGHPSLPGFHQAGVTSPADCNDWTSIDPNPYLVFDGWHIGYEPGEIFDNTPLTGTIVINSGKPTTTNTNVTLYLTRTDLDPAYGPWYMRFTNSPVIRWSAWKPYNNTRLNWPLLIWPPDGEGIKTVYVQFKSRVSYSLVYSDEIIYSLNEDPVCTVTSPDDGDYLSGQIDITFTITDTNDDDVMVTAWVGITQVGSTLVENTAGGVEDTITFDPADYGITDNEYTIKIKCDDGQGGVTTPLGIDVTIDNTAPTVTSLTVNPDPAGLGDGFTPVPADTGLQIQVVFNETMDTSYPPTVTYDPTGVIGPQPCTSNGAWSPTPITYTVFNTNAIDDTTGDGPATVTVTAAQDLAGNISVITTTTFLININLLVLQNQTAVPLRFNPFLGETTTVSYVLSEPAQNVTITVVDDLNNVITLYSGVGVAGINSFTWDASVGSFPFRGQPYQIVFNASNPWETAVQSMKNINISDISIITDASNIPYPFQPLLGAIATIQFSNIDTSNPPIDILMSIKDITGTTITDSGPNYDNQWVGDFGSEDWDGTNTPLFAGGGILVNDGIYEYVIEQTKPPGPPPPPPFANSKTGTIVLLNSNTSVTSTPDGAVTVYYNPLTPGLGTINIQPVDPTTLTDEVMAIVTNQPLVYIQSDIYDIVATPPVNFTLTPALVVFQYDPTITGDVTDRLLLRFWNTAVVPPALPAWEDVLPQRIDLVNHQIIAEITSLSLFALFTGADTTPPVITITSPAPMEYPNFTDGQPTIIPITYVAEDPVIDGVTSGISYTSVTLNGQVYTQDTIDLSNLFGENTLTVKAIDGSGNVARQTVRFTVVLSATVTLKPESLKVNPGVLTAFVRFPTGYDVMSIIDATCDKAQYESMELATDGVTKVFKFRRKAIEKALAEIGQTIDTEFEVRGTFQIDQQTYIFKGTDTIQKVLLGSVPSKNK